MDSGSLHNASSYLNNLLLARGLLRNGKSIDFAGAKKGSAGTENTMAEIINLVHDLVIRRDRDADQRESLARNICHLRAEESQKASEVERLLIKNVELLRNLALAEGQKKSLETSARRAEASARELKEQMAKMKSTLDQVRAKCVNDVRKRDIELEKLKKHVTGIQRGATHSSGMKIVQLNPQLPLVRNARELRSGVPVDDENWSLEKETNDFLAALVNETSTENVALRHMVAETMKTLKGLTGIDQASEKPVIDPEIGIPGQYKQSRIERQSAQSEALVPCEELAKQLDMVVGHCCTILKDPSFVSIEEVQIREEEIIKLREGWEKMASRWKDAVAMMDTWRKRIVEGGNPVDLDELTSLGMGKSMAVVHDAQAATDPDGSSAAIFDNDLEDINEEIDESSNRGGDDTESEANLEIALQPATKRLASSPARREVDGNVQPKQSQSERTSSNTSNVNSGISSPDSSVGLGVQLGENPSAKSLKTQMTSPPLSVADKLAMIEAEAREAEQQQDLKHKRKAPRPLGQGKASRRRSTLSPEELAQLMGMR